VANRPAQDIIGKDTAQNIRNTHEFVINVVNEEVTTLWKSKDEKGGPELCDLTIDGAKGGLKRGNTPMMITECYDGRKDRSGEKGSP